MASLTLAALQINQQPVLLAFSPMRSTPCKAQKGGKPTAASQVLSFYLSLHIGHISQ